MAGTLERVRFGKRHPIGAIAFGATVGGVAAALCYRFVFNANASVLRTIAAGLFFGALFFVTQVGAYALLDPGQLRRHS